MSRGWCLGSREFRAQMKARMEAQGGTSDVGPETGLDRPTIQTERERGWEDRLQVLAGLAGIDLNRLSEKKSDENKVLLAAAMKQSSSVSNAWLAERLGMGKPASASQFARRFLLGRNGKIQVATLLSRVKT
jgi:hypothetical protein